MSSVRFYPALWMSKLSIKLINIIASGRGTNLPGQIALKIDPLFLEHVKGIDPERVIFVTGTNGKSTSVNIINHILTSAGYSVSCNIGGANMNAGVSVPLVQDAKMGGSVRTDYLVMEVDERCLESIRKQIPAKYVCVTNIQKDQAQRNGEVSFITNKIRKAMGDDCVAVLNRDEPVSYSLSEDAASFVTYGVSENRKSFVNEDDFFGVSMPCPRCHDALSFRFMNLGNTGCFSCPSCGFGADEKSVKADYVIDNIDYESSTISIDGETIQAKYTAPPFLYCYSLAYAVLAELGIPKDVIRRGIETFTDIKGRVAEHEISGSIINYMKMKQENSETLQSSIDYIAEKPGPKDLFIGFDEYLDFYPGYSFIFNLFDCDFRKMAGPDISRWTCTSKALANAAAVKFCYDGFPLERFRAADASTSELISGLISKDVGDGLTDDIYMIEEVPFWKKR